MIESRCLHLLLADGSERDTSTAFFESYRRINQPRPEERALARVSKDGHKRDRASGHPSRRRFAPPQDEVCGFKLHPPVRWFHGIDLLIHLQPVRLDRSFPPCDLIDNELAEVFRRPALTRNRRNPELMQAGLNRGSVQ